MAEAIEAQSTGQPNLNLTAEEKRYYGQLFRSADPDGFGAVSGDVAVKFFEKTKLQADVLGQAGRNPTPELATQNGPLPRFEGIQGPAPPAPTATPTSPVQPSGGPIRVPPLGPDKVNEYASLFEKSGAENGILSGVTAKQIFERARLPNEVLGRIWNLADTKERGALDTTEFVIAMHLLASYKSGAMKGVPQALPPGLYEAASRRGIQRTSTGSRPSSAVPPSGIPPQHSGFAGNRAQSPIQRQQFGTPLSAQSTGDGWLITPADKSTFDNIFNTVDKANRGFITGDQAVEFFSNSRLPEETLAQIWDLSDINSEGQLNKDEFAVAMYLIRQQRGSVGGRGSLPPTLPPALVPPNMRRQQIPPSQPTAPIFDNASNITKPKSAADDLFGLDAMTSTPTPAAPKQEAQTTGSSAGQFRGPASPPPGAAPQQASSTFKPFVPSSSFGQSIAPQSTGLSQTRAAPQQTGQASDDLLGDADPEISGKLTQETSELANLSNQVGTLSKQMQDVQGNRASTERELSQSSQQKKDFESRLSQLRSMYQKEVQDVKSLEERLAASRNDVKNLQQEMAMIDGSYQDLKNQHQQIASALEADQRENASLKDKIREINNDVSQLKPQLEKMRSDARQQKGLVAINKKQLSTNEGERDRLQSEIENEKKEAEERERSIPPAPSASSNVLSPAASVASQNTNPFFRRTTSTTSEAAAATPAAVREATTDPHAAFDSVFGPSFSASSATPPPTTFRSDSPNVEKELPSGQVASGASTPTMSPHPSTSNDSPHPNDPPPPPQSRQITSSSLPFTSQIDRADSPSSSVKVSAPASRLGLGDTPRAGTPSVSVSGAHSDAPSSPTSSHREAAPEFNADQRTPIATSGEANPIEAEFGPASDLREIPGAFPSAQTPMTERSPPQQAEETTAKDGNFDDFFGGPAHERSSSQKAADFDEAFATLSKKPGASNEQPQPSQAEFPPIRELGDDDSDSSEEPMGFDDDFSPTEGPRATEDKPSSSNPVTDSSNTAASTSQPNNNLPPIEAQASPPTYDDSVPQEQGSHFPPEFNGLLPRRDDPTSPPGEPHSLDSKTGAPADHSLPQPYAPEASKSPPASMGNSTAQMKPSVEDDFDAAFAGFNTAQPAVTDEDDDEDDELDKSFTSTNNHTGVFDPRFDSPAPPARQSEQATPSAMNNHTTPSNNDFANFESSFSAAQSSPPAAQPAASTAQSQSHDWDAIFAGLDAPAPSTEVTAPTSPPPAQNAIPSPARGAALLQTSKALPQRPQPGRALSAGTEHDDPILKRLTGMGWSREESLGALERFDYNLDKNPLSDQGSRASFKQAVSFVLLELPFYTSS
ncbi:MAG: hypothetical protein Q9227_004067 [Pyrenula ochraceoflavens]